MSVSGNGIIERNGGNGIIGHFDQNIKLKEGTADIVTIDIFSLVLSISVFNQIMVSNT